MSTGGGNEWKDLGAIAGSILSIVAVIKLIIMPIAKAWRKWREAHPPFKKTVLLALKELKEGQAGFDDFNAAMLRERLEDAYIQYVLDMGWCPSREKRLLAELFKLSKSKGWDIEHLDEKHYQLIMNLPESRDQRKEYPQ